MNPDRTIKLAVGLSSVVALLMGGSPAAARNITCGADDAVACHGTPKDDSILGSRRVDRVHARGGDDTVHGGKGGDIVYAGGGRDQVRGENGADTVYLGRGGDASKTPQSAWGQGGDDKLIGGPQAERLLGGPGTDRLVGRAGDDYLEPGSGSDIVKAGAGDDNVDAVQMRNQRLPGDATLRIFGGTGSDVIQLVNDGAVDYIDCGDGADTVTWLDQRDPQDVLDDCEHVPSGE